MGNWNLTLVMMISVIVFFINKIKNNNINRNMKECVFTILIFLGYILFLQRLYILRWG